MAKKTDEQTPDSAADTTPAPEQASPEQATPEPVTPSVTQVENDAPLPLQELASRHRVPTWQQAALERMMGWEDGKAVTDAEYLAALAALAGRKLGSGRA